MEIYINESSLTGQYFSEAEFSAAVIAFMAIFDKVNEKKLVAYKQRNVLLHKKALLESIFPSSLEQLRNKSLKEAFRRLVFNRSNPKDWTLEQLHLASDVFLCPEIDDTVENTVLAEVAERLLQDENDMPRLLDGPIAFHAHDAVHHGEGVGKEPVELEDRRVDAFVVEEVLRPAVDAAGDEAEEVLHRQGDTGPVMGFQLGHLIVLENSVYLRRKPHAGVLRLLYHGGTGKGKFHITAVI